MKALALVALVFIWIWSGVSSLISFEASNDLMQQLPLDKNLATGVIYFTSVVDILLGVLLFNRKLRKFILLLQMIFLLSFTIIVGVFIPEFWFDPFGSIAKNIPILVLSLYLYMNSDY